MEKKVPCSLAVLSSSTSVYELIILKSTNIQECVEFLKHDIYYMFIVYIFLLYI